MHICISKLCPPPPPVARLRCFEKSEIWIQSIIALLSLYSSLSVAFLGKLDYFIGMSTFAVYALYHLGRLVGEYKRFFCVSWIYRLVMILFSLAILLYCCKYDRFELAENKYHSVGLLFICSLSGFLLLYQLGFLLKNTRFFKCMVFMG